ncbi:MAG TPA: hypothetical protein VL405_03540, partial [Sphingomonas sp.]|nr:hypothetical protein [Sphingomonas sp.]
DIARQQLRLARGEAGQFAAFKDQLKSFPWQGCPSNRMTQELDIKILIEELPQFCGFLARRS